MEMDTNLLEQIQMYNFAAYDMLLYLDTHADDKTAFEMFRELVAKTRALKAQYEKSYGPLTAMSLIHIFLHFHVYGLDFRNQLKIRNIHK